MSNLPEWLIFAVLLFLVIVVVWGFWFWSQRNTRRTEERIKKYQLPLEDTPPGAPVSSVGMDDLGDQLDGRIAALSQLLRAAEEQSARLERAVAEAKKLRP